MRREDLSSQDYLGQASARHQVSLGWHSDQEHFACVWNRFYVRMHSRAEGSEELVCKDEPERGYDWHFCLSYWPAQPKVIRPSSFRDGDRGYNRLAKAGLQKEEIRTWGLFEWSVRTGKWKIYEYGWVQETWEIYELGQITLNLYQL